MQSPFTYQVVSGDVDARQVVASVTKRTGIAELATVAGGKLTASLQGVKIMLTDASDGELTVTATGLKASHGVIHVINTVLMPANQFFLYPGSSGCDLTTAPFMS